VVHQLLSKTMQKISAKVSNKAPRHLWKKGWLEATSSFAPPNICPALKQQK